MPRTMWQALAGYLGSNTTASPGEEGEKIFKTNDWGRLKEGFARGVPLRWLGNADEIAKPVSLLASDDASYVSGIELLVDGGVAQV